MRTTVMTGRAASLGLALALVALGAACVRPAPTTVEGITLYQVCGGVQPEPGQDPCQTPEPVAGTVTVLREGAVVATTRSDATGRFQVRLTPGEFTAELTLDPGSPFVICPQVPVTVPAPAPVTLVCRLLAP